MPVVKSAKKFGVDSGLGCGAGRSGHAHQHQGQQKDKQTGGGKGDHEETGGFVSERPEGTPYPGGNSSVVHGFVHVVSVGPQPSVVSGLFSGFVVVQRGRLCVPSFDMINALSKDLPFVGVAMCQWWASLQPAGAATLGVMVETGLTDPIVLRQSLDELVLAVARERSRRAFGALFGHFAPRLKSYLKRLGTDSAQAEELVQEVMLLVWHRAETFDPTQANASTWVFTIARNKRIDAIRRERRPEFDPNDPALVPQAAEAADRSIETGQETARLRAAIGSLPQEQAELLRLAYFDDKPHSVISVERGLPLGTVKSRLRLALERLRRLLREPV